MYQSLNSNVSEQEMLLLLLLLHLVAFQFS